MPNTMATQQVGLMNELNATAVLMYQQYVYLTDLAARLTDENAGADFALLNTCALNADGSLGAADPSPVNSSTHVIDPRVYVGLNRALTLAQWEAVGAFVGGMQIVLGQTANINAMMPCQGS